MLPQPEAGGVRHSALSARRLAAELVARLDPIVPRPFTLRVDDRDVVVDHPDDWGLLMRMGDLLDPVDLDAPDADPRSEKERAEVIVSAVLNAVQTAVSECLRDDWPRLPGGGTADNGSRYDEDAIYLWYGLSEASPTVAFAPIRFRDIAEPV